MSAEVSEATILSFVRRETAAFIAELRCLPEEAWRAPTDCPGWDVQAIAAHISLAGRGFARTLEEGLAGRLVPIYASPEARAQAIAAEAAQSPAQILAALEEGAARFERVCSGLTPGQWRQVQGLHAFGPRSARWFALQRLAELAFHRWDIRSAVGRGDVFDPEVADALLPMLIEENLPSIYQRAGLKGASATWRLVSRGRSGRAWALRIGEGRLTVGEGDAQATIAGPPDALALLIYGRRPLEELRALGQVAVSGDVGLAARLKEFVPGP